MNIKIERQDLNEQVYQILKDQILTREFKGGARLDLNDLSKKMGVSKTPVKLAIHRLENDGLVDVVSRSGTYVTKLTSDQIAAVMDARIMIEEWCLEHLSQDACEQLSIQLEELVRKAEDVLNNSSFNYQLFLELDIAFHKTIVTVNHNHIINKQYDLLNSFLYISRIFHFQNLERSKEGMLEHYRIMEEIKNGHIQQAAELLITHLEQSKRYMIHLIEQNNGSI